MRKSVLAISATVSVFAWSEYVHWRSSARRLGAVVKTDKPEVIVVLGYKNRGERANLVNRYRIRAALRSRHGNNNVRLILSGGSVSGRVPEAELMARYARNHRGYNGEIVTETASRSTWENIQNILPYIEDASHIKIVSNSLHAEKGRAYLWALRPDLAEKLVKAEEYRFGEMILLKPVMALIGLRNLRKIRK